MNMEDKFLKVAKEAAVEAQKVILKYSNTNKINIKNDSPSDLVTKADVEAEKKIIKTIKASFPNHNIIAEESGSNSQGSDYTWFIDPIDGTTSFIAQIPSFSIAICLMHKNQPILGVVNIFGQNKLVWAQKNKGTYINGERVRVSKTNNLADALVGFDFGKTKFRQVKLDNYFLPLIHKIRSAYSFGAATISAVYVGMGMLDAFASQAYVWDLVSTAVIIEEAGGRVTSLKGEAIDWSKERADMVASNGIIHDQILEALKR